MPGPTGLAERPADGDVVRKRNHADTGDGRIEGIVPVVGDGEVITCVTILRDAGHGRGRHRVLVVAPPLDLADASAGDGHEVVSRQEVGEGVGVATDSVDRREDTWRTAVTRETHIDPLNQRSLATDGSGEAFRGAVIIGAPNPHLVVDP